MANNRQFNGQFLFLFQANNHLIDDCFLRNQFKWNFIGKFNMFFLFCVFVCLWLATKSTMFSFYGLNFFSFVFIKKKNPQKNCVLVQHFCVSSVLHLWTNVLNVQTKFIRIMPGINYSMLHVAIIVVVVVIVIVVVHLYLNISIMQHMLSYSRVECYIQSPFFILLSF